MEQERSYCKCNLVNSDFRLRCEKSRGEGMVKYIINSEGGEVNIRTGYEEDIMVTKEF